MTKLPSSFTALVVWLLAMGIAACSQPAVSRSNHGATTVTLEPYVGRLVTVSVASGRTPLKLLFDTGGGQTLLTPQAAGKVGCAPRGRSVGYRMSGERVDLQRCDDVPLTLGGRSLKGPGVGVWDLSAVLPEEFPPVDGVLALDALGTLPFTLDLEGRTLSLESDSSLSARIAGASRVASRLATGVSGAELTVFVEARLGVGGWLLVDSGNLDAVQIAAHLGAPAAPHSDEPFQAEITVTGLEPAPAAARVRALIHDGALSEAFLRRWVWTFRLATGEVWARPR
jgi:hypothetical protein